MLTFIQPYDEVDSFPPLDKAEKDPNGLLAIGGDLSPARLLEAYQRGIFPWFNEGQNILWWSPDPRMVLYPNEFHASRSLKKNIRKFGYRFSVNKAFDKVIRACAEPRSYSSETWINQQMQQAYQQLHKLGYAHSVEIWQEDELVGGLYGIALGEVFFGESMFSTNTDASKAAFQALCQLLKRLEFHFIDCQVYSEHLETLGAREITRDDFEIQLKRFCNKKEKLLMHRQLEQVTNEIS